AREGPGEGAGAQPRVDRRRRHRGSISCHGCGEADHWGDPLHRRRLPHYGLKPDTIEPERQVMSDLVFIAFPSEEKAEEVRKKVLAMQKEYLIELGDAVVAVKNADGQIKLNQLMNLTATGALSGAMWGALVGLIFLSPLIGAAVGAASGAL